MKLFICTEVVAEPRFCDAKGVVDCDRRVWIGDIFTWDETIDVTFDAPLYALKPLVPRYSDVYLMLDALELHRYFSEMEIAGDLDWSDIYDEEGFLRHGRNP